MEHFDIVSELYKMQLDKGDIIDEVHHYQLDGNNAELERLGYVVEAETGERGRSLFAKPTDISLPFILISTTLTEKGERFDINLGWTTLNEKGEIPNAVSSQSAYREGNKPAVISAQVENGNVLLKEVLFTDELGFERLVFDKKGNIDSKWFFMKNKEEHKIYEMNRPLYVSYYSNGNPKEVWNSNPLAKKFVETSCTYRMKDDHPVVVSFYESGEIEKVDYTGVTFADPEVPPTIENFPFNSRYRFYLPSFYHYAKKNEYGRQSLINTKYFLHKEDTPEDEVLGIIESYGLDASKPDEVEEMLKANPIFEKTIRSMFAIGVISDKQLDETMMLHSVVKK